MPTGHYQTKETRKKISAKLLGIKRSQETIRKMKLGQFMEKSTGWLGDNANYFTKHHWVRDHYGNPSYCVDCGKTGKKVNGRWIIEWSNFDHRYGRSKEDYVGRCKKCHIKYDRENNIYRSK